MRQYKFVGVALALALVAGSALLGGEARAQSEPAWTYCYGYKEKLYDQERPGNWFFTKPVKVTRQEWYPTTVKITEWAAKRGWTVVNCASDNEDPSSRIKSSFSPSASTNPYAYGVLLSETGVEDGPAAPAARQNSASQTMPGLTVDDHPAEERARAAQAKKGEEIVAKAQADAEARKAKSRQEAADSRARTEAARQRALADRKRWEANCKRDSKGRCIGARGSSQ